MGVLESKGDAKVRAMNLRNGAQENQFGVKMGDIRAIAKTIKVDHELGSELWRTGNVDAMFLATLVVKPKLLPEEELSGMVASVTFTHIADWLMTNVVKLHPAKESLRNVWIESPDPTLSRAGWSLTTERVIKQPDGLDFDAFLDRIEKEMPNAPAPAQWTMNYCLAEIGIESAAHRERAIAIGEKLGIYRDYPTPKGCTSPFAPIWIAAMVARK